MSLPCPRWPEKCPTADSCAAIIAAGDCPFKNKKTPNKCCVTEGVDPPHIRTDYRSDILQDQSVKNWFDYWFLCPNYYDEKTIIELVSFWLFDYPHDYAWEDEKLMVTSLEYFLHIVNWPENTYYYIGDIVLWFLFSAFMVNEAVTGLTQKR